MRHASLERKRSTSAGQSVIAQVGIGASEPAIRTGSCARRLDLAPGQPPALHRDETRIAVAIAPAIARPVLTRKARSNPFVRATEGAGHPRSTVGGFPGQARGHHRCVVPSILGVPIWMG